MGVFTRLSIFGMWLASMAFGQTHDISHLLANQIELQSGAIVRLQSPIKKGYRLQFVDLYPGANWGHPAEIQLLDSNEKVLEKHAVNFPPVAWKLENAFLDHIDYNVTFKLSDWGGKRKLKKPELHYALLINGSAQERHWNDLAFMYRTLTTVYGYDTNNIFVADSNHKVSRADLNKDGIEDIRYGSTGAELEGLFSHLSTTLTKKHHLIVVVNTHGSVKNKLSTLVLPDGEWNEMTFASKLRTLTTKSKLLIYQPCFGGGFVRPTVNTRNVAMAAATDNEFSWASMNLKFNEFLYLVTAAFAGQTHDGRPANADLNQDGQISAKEAYGFAVLQNKRRESPLLESSPNSGLAAHLGFSGLIP